MAECTLSLAQDTNENTAISFRPLKPNDTKLFYIAETN